MFLVFDVGGTKTRLGVSKDLKSLEETVVLDTTKKFEEGLAVFVKAGKKILAGEKAEAIAGGIAGPFDERKRSLVGSPNLKDWIGKPFLEELRKEFDAPVYIENDTAMAGLGEAHFGAGRGFKIVAYMTLSTGIGGCRIVDGKIDEKTIGFEPGHQIIDAGKALCPECEGQHLEYYLSGNAVKKRMGQSPEEINDSDFWNKQALFLAYGLNNTIVHWSPEAVVLGGSQMKKIPLDVVNGNLSKVLKIFPELPKLKLAELGDLGGLWGSMTFLREKLRMFAEK